ncbi:MAG: prolyl oligopeptidase family serine peptidase [candidate division Zixibacteria bacterium]|nr:prolyl oligopeptidase family serine peptidase [candidate division Zixibacteria bacterium]
MTSPQPLLLDRERVTLADFHENVVRRMYAESVLDDTIVERITYLSDGLRVKGYLAKPKAPGKYPLLIWNRGGYGTRGALDDLTAYLILASTAVWGYILLATHYRGNLGGEGVEDWGGNDVHDSLNLIDVAKELPECDITRIGIEGASRGGMTTYRVLTMYDKFRCGIIHAGVADLFRLAGKKPSFTSVINLHLGNLSETDRNKEIKKRSAVCFADKLPKNVPLLLLHGTKDQTVPIEQSQLLVAQLKAHNIPHEFIKIQDGGHVSLKDKSYIEIDRYRRKWLEKYLK